MKVPEQLYKTTIVIWTNYEPLGMEINDLAQEAMDGDAYCELQETTRVTDRAQFPATEFFGESEEEP